VVINYKDIALKIFLTVAKLLITVTYYLMVWLNKSDDSIRHDVTAGLHCWQY